MNMILQEEVPPFQYFTIFDSLESGLYMVIVGYYFLIFAFFLLMRFRTSKKPYWFFFSILFICLAIARVFFIAYYFYVPELPLTGWAMVSQLMIFYRLATFFTWMGISSLMGVLGILLLPPEAKKEVTGKKEEETKEKKRFNFSEKQKLLLRIILLVIPVVIGILALALPDVYLMDLDFVDDYSLTGIQIVTVNIGSWSYPLGRFILNIVCLPLLVCLIPIIFFYLAWKTFGVLRKSYFLNAIGFIINFAGRIAQGLLDSACTLTGGEYGCLTRAILPPLLILLSLIIIVIANNYEQLK